MREQPLLQDSAANERLRTPQLRPRGTGVGLERRACIRVGVWRGVVTQRCACNAEMRKLQAQDATSTLRFNLEIAETQYANVTVGGAGRNMTFTVMVPVLTNTVELEEGEQLCFEVVRKAATIKRKVSNRRTAVTSPNRGRPTAIAAEKGKRVSDKAVEQAGCSSVASIVEL